MSPTNQVNAILSIELLHDLASEEIASATRTDHPPWNVIGVGPHEITHGSIVRNLLFAINHSDLIQSAYRWRQAAMDAEDFVVNDGCQGQIVKDLRAVAPHID